MKKRVIHLERTYKHPRFDNMPACGFLDAYYFTNEKQKVTCKRCLKLIVKKVENTAPRQS